MSTGVMDKLPENLAAQARWGRLAHAYILSGAREETVDALGRTLAAAMVCEGGGDKPCGTCKHCRKALRDIHPDVIHLAPEEGKDFTVAQARALRADAYVTPNEAHAKVYLIHRAQRMNPQAQNALLKLLEEGPRYAAFLLLTDNPDALLETIRSRCEAVRAAEDNERAQAKEAGEALAKALLGEDRWAAARYCVPLEKGRREETAALWEAAREALLTRCAGRDKARAVELMETLGENLRLLKQNVNLGALWGRLYALE